MGRSAKDRRIRKPETKQHETLQFQQHCRALGLETAADYRDWCLSNGFQSTLRKHKKQRAQELHHAHAVASKKNYSLRRRQSRNPIDTLKLICQDQIEFANLAMPQYQVLFRMLRDTQSVEVIGRDDLWRLVEHAGRCRAKFFEGVLVASHLGLNATNTFLYGLSIVAAYAAHWIRTLEDWRPSSHNPRRQFASLLRHLFDRHSELPKFFDTVWFLDRQPEAARRRLWYLHVGRGHSLRTCDLPLPYTKRMARDFLRAPDHLTVDQALRWGQVIGFGGDARLASAIVVTRLGSEFIDDKFWASVIRWLIAHPWLDRAHVGPIVDYLYHQKFVPVDRGESVLMVHAHAPTISPPAEPNLSMKGRTPRSLLRQVDRWHNNLARCNLNQLRQWRPCGVPGFSFAEGNPQHGNQKIWTIRELLSNHSLHAEGRVLKHCVASYAQSCARGLVSIWTLELQSNGELAKLITIELQNGSRVICQARGKRNRWPNDKELQIIRRWASQAALSVAANLK